ncbi:glycosyltransferase [Pelomonas sp. APW6]|uniref:Glycosyltransferase n=1 Tax=Roseateles subflavus TaxID=3053353 RepID=A0ABT7LPY1_9BURK|nr:glycosyltransferase [Pelomonas sp. APW6]MDL5033795.1 glycosyltransferase [Pelomonas sp. APW6]
MAARSLRIVLISEHASPLAQAGSVDAGGQNIYVAHVAAALARRGHEVEVLTRRDSPELPAVQPMGEGVRVHHLDAGPAQFIPKEQLLPHVRDFELQARALLRRLPPCDLVHANFFMSGLAGLQLQRRLGLPLVVTFHALGAVRRLHQAGADSFPVERVDLERQVAHGADRVIAECPQDRQDLMTHYHLPERQITEVPCGVDLHEFRPGDLQAARARLGLSPRDFIVLQLGRLVPRKGIDNVIRALSRLPGIHNDECPRRARLLVVGGESEQPDERLTPEIGRLRRLAQSLGVKDRVQFIGRRSRPELASYYQAADVFVSTPWYEPFGITPLESMACARPVIGSAVGGIQHTVVDGVTGYLVPPMDADTLAAHLDWLRQHPQQAEAMGRAGLGRVRRMFTWDQVAARLEAVYRRVMAERSQPVTATAAHGLGLLPAGLGRVPAGAVGMKPLLPARTPLWSEPASAVAAWGAKA